MLWRRKLPRSSKLFGALAIVLGTAAFLTVQAERQRYAALLPAAGPAVPVVVATSPIPRGTTIQAPWLEVREIPEAFAPPGVIGSPDDAVGRILAADVVAGEPITRARLLPTGTGPLAGALPDGWRAYALPAAAPPGLRAGDRVDVLATYVDRAYTQPVALGVEVLRVEAANGLDPAAPGSVVVATTPETSLRLATAAATSRLTLAIVGAREHAS
jgi:Flp pilus assembly protein CpaB